MRIRATALLCLASCSYDWAVGPVPAGGGGAGEGGSAQTTSATGEGGATTATQGGGGAAPQDCATLRASYEAALAAAKVCSQSEVGVCDQAFLDICGCKVFLAHLESDRYPEIGAAFDARDAFSAAGCPPMCVACGPELITGGCSPEGMTTVCKP